MPDFWAYHTNREGKQLGITGPHPTREAAIEAGKAKFPGKDLSHGYGANNAHFDIRHTAMKSRIFSRPDSDARSDLSMSDIDNRLRDIRMREQAGDITPAQARDMRYAIKEEARTSAVGSKRLASPDRRSSMPVCPDWTDSASGWTCSMRRCRRTNARRWPGS